MRTKHILTALVLPALFAACTADEFTNEEFGKVEGRALLNPITFTLGDAETRFAWDETGYGNWKYEDTDAFSAFLVDGDMGTVSDALLTNYIYKSADKGATFTTTSQMVEGTYWFYAPSPESKNTRDLIPFKLQTAQDEDYYLSEDAQVFFTALYKLTKDDDPQNIALSLTNYYSRAVLPFTNNTDGDVTVNQIVLKATSPFVVAGNISVKSLDNAGLAFAFDEDGELVPVRNLDKDTKNDETVAKLKERLQQADLVEEDEKSKKTSDVLVLNLGDGVKIAKGATHTFTMLVPRTDTGVSCEIEVIADKGVLNIEKTDKSNFAKNIQFKHNGIMPMFGLQNDNSFKAYSIEKDRFKDLDGARYVANYDDMITLINTVNGNFKVYNIGDWSVDAAMAKAITRSDSYVTFMQPTTIADDSEVVELTKVEFAGDVTVEKGADVVFEKGNITDKKNVVGKALNIAEGATVELKEGTFTNAKINNAGKLTVGNVGATTIASTGALKLVDNTTAEVKLNAGSLEYTTAGTTNVTYNLDNVTFVAANNMTADLNITIGKNVTLSKTTSTWLTTPSYKDNDVAYATNITNNGVLYFQNSGVGVSGKLVNNGTVDANQTKTLTINGGLENKEDAIIASGVKVVVAKGAVATNAGTIENVYENNGLITTVSGSRTTVNGGEGEVDNTAKARVIVGQSANNLLISYTFAACDNEDVDALDTRLYAINKLVFTSKLTLKDDIAKGEGVRTIEFAQGSSVEIGANVLQGSSAAKIIISGNVKFSGWDTELSKLGFKNDGTVEVKKNCTLTFSNMTFGSKSGTATFEFGAAESKDDKAGKVVNNGAVKNAAEDYSTSDNWTGAAPEVAAKP